jgi:hypothetical protein
MPKQLIAAGGLLTNPEGAILWIFRRGFWDLPKGKLDEGETIDTYLNEEVVKRTYWFHMTIPDFQEGIPQISEDIEKIEWHSLATCRHCLDNTYPNIIEVIEAYRKKINL